MIRFVKAACLAAIIALAGCASNAIDTAGVKAGQSKSHKSTTKLAYGGDATGATEKKVLFPDEPAFLVAASAKQKTRSEPRRGEYQKVLFPREKASAKNTKKAKKGAPARQTLFADRWAGKERKTTRTVLSPRLSTHGYASTRSLGDLQKAARKETTKKKARVVKKKRVKAVAKKKTSVKKVAKATRKTATKKRRVVAKARKAKVATGGGATHQAVTRHAKAHGVPVALAHAVVRVESNYRANARGAAGEIGLMQVKLATARLMGYRGSAKGLYDPDTNLKYGMKYLAKAHKLGGGSVCGTILKYNAGHGAKRMNPISRRYCTKVKGYL